ncbi:MAG: hypothetical protein AAGE94_08765 [Acidobacteriota bacterium]
MTPAKSNRSLTSSIAAMIAVCLIPVESSAQSLEGQDFAASAVVRVNENTAGNQTNPAVDAAADGSRVVVWQESDIEGRRLTADLTPVGSDFQVSFGTYSNAAPDVCVDAQGDFVAVWQFSGFVNDIRVRRNVGGSFAPQISDDIANSLRNTNIRQSPAVDCTTASEFVVAWQGETPEDDNAIAGRRFTVGVAQGATEFQVNTYTADPSLPPDIAMDANGDFVVAWGQSDSVVRGLGGNAGVATRRFQADGTALDAMQVLTMPHSGSLYNVNVDRHPDGDFVVVWEDNTQLNATVSAELFNPQGVSLATGQFAPSGNFSGDVQGYGVFAGPDGAFLIAANEPGGSEFEFQRFTDPLATSGDPWTAPGGPSSRDPFDIVGRADGSFVVVWSENNDIFAQQWIPALFADGFEGGNTMQWATQVP